MQHPGRTILTIARHPDLPVLNTCTLTNAQLVQSDAIQADFAARSFRPANEAWHDTTRQDLDHALLIDLLGLLDSILEPLSFLRKQWCAEPSVYGTKWRTAPPEVRPAVAN